MDEQMSLWQSVEDPQSHFLIWDMPDANVVFYEQLFSAEESDRLFAKLDQEIQWQQGYIHVFDKTLPLPRLTAWYGEPGKSYTYSGIEMHPTAWTSTLLEIKARVEAYAGVTFNSVLLNQYRTGQDSVAWHSDDEPELGQNPMIGSVSFGGTRRFVLRHKYQKKQDKVSLDLTHGSFLLVQVTT